MMDPALRGTAAVAMLAAGLMASPASANLYTWETDGGDWDVSENWAPDGIPGAGDTAVVGDGTTAISMTATGSAPTPDSVTVRNNATVVIKDFIGASGFNQTFIIESGGTLDASDYNNYGWNATLNDNTTLLLSQLMGRDGQTITITGDVSMSYTQSAVQSSIRHEVKGSGEVTLSVAAGKTVTFDTMALPWLAYSTSRQAAQGSRVRWAMAPMV